MDDMFDLEKFAEMLRVAVARLNIEQREAARQIGITETSMSRICATKGGPSVDSYVKIINWLDRVEKELAA